MLGEIALFLYALRRDVVSDHRYQDHAGRRHAGFYTPFGVTWFPTLPRLGWLCSRHYAAVLHSRV
jgi:hypothetical protein